MKQEQCQTGNLAGVLQHKLFFGFEVCPNDKPPSAFVIGRFHPPPVLPGPSSALHRPSSGPRLKDSSAQPPSLHRRKASEASAYGEARGKGVPPESLRARTLGHQRHSETFLQKPTPRGRTGPWGSSELGGSLILWSKGSGTLLLLGGQDSDGRLVVGGFNCGGLGFWRFTDGRKK